MQPQPISQDSGANCSIKNCGVNFKLQIAETSRLCKLIVKTFYSLSKMIISCICHMCNYLPQAIENNFMYHVVFNDKVTFNICRHVNKHKCRIQTKEQPYLLQECLRDTSKVNVWVGFTRSKAYGAFLFAEETITGNVLLDIFVQSLETQLRSDRIVDTVMLQQHGVPPHYTVFVRYQLKHAFLTDGLVKARQKVGSTVKKNPSSRFLFIGIYEIHGVPGEVTQH